MKPVIMFTVSSGNLGNTSTLLEIARACAADFEPIFLCYSFRFSNLISEAGFKTVFLPPIRVRPVNPSPQKFVRQIEAEMALYERYRPVAIVNKHELGPVFSARAAGIPLVWVLPYAWTRPCHESGLLGDHPLTVAEHFYPGQPLPAEAEFLAPYQETARLLGLPIPTQFHDLFEGDLTIVTDLPELTGQAALPAGYTYSGPIFARLPGETPAWVGALDQTRPIIYFAMGSSGDPELLAAMLPHFARRPDWQVIAPIKARLRGQEVTAPANVQLSDWLPAHLVNPVAHVALTHGGLGTLYTAVTAGTPTLGIPMSPEQRLNLRLLADAGLARSLDSEAAAAGGFIEPLAELLADEAMRARAAQWQARLAAVDGPARAAEALRQFVAAPTAAD
ncbi:MAG: hypothetical protein KDE34_05460 [Anaerolineales bacterium]|nr:hypothetical protein [Anaerolineales bacterium]MCB8960141.1 hypothetical protein [Ardenticatenales bacterium]